MSRRGNSKETPEWVDSDDNSANAAKNKFTFQEERPQQNVPKVLQQNAPKVNYKM